MPPVSLQRNASGPLGPTTNRPSGDIACAIVTAAPGRTPRSVMPPASVQRNAALRDGSHAKPTEPTITWPSPETRLAALEVPPGRKPSPTMPIELVQRNASCSEFALVLTPTITEPSADTAFALLLVLLPPGDGWRASRAVRRCRPSPPS